jgi:hypothetical protein
MHRTIEAIVHPDGRVELLEPVLLTTTQRALVTVLAEEPRKPLENQSNERMRIRVALAARGAILPPLEIPAEHKLMSNSEREALAAQIGPGVSLSTYIMQEREEGL